MSLLELKKNPKLDLDVPKFVCDHNPLGEHLNKYEMLSHKFLFVYDLGWTTRDLIPHFSKLISQKTMIWTRAKPNSVLLGIPSPFRPNLPIFFKYE